MIKMILAAIALACSISCSSSYQTPTPTNTTTGCKTNADCTGLTNTCSITGTTGTCYCGKGTTTCSTLVADTCGALGCQCGTAAACAAGQRCLSSTCQSVRYVFETAYQYAPGTVAWVAPSTWPNTAFSSTGPQPVFSSAADADAICQWEADNAKNNTSNNPTPAPTTPTLSLVKNKKFAAWIATSTNSPLARLVPSRIAASDTLPVYLPSGATPNTSQVSGPVRTPIAPATGGIADFADTTLAHLGNINVDATGTSVGTIYAFTGSANSTTNATTTAQNCSDWGSNSSSVTPYTGNHGTLLNWYYDSANSNAKCNLPSAFYCIQVDK